MTLAPASNQLEAGRSEATREDTCNLYQPICCLSAVRPVSASHCEPFRLHRQMTTTFTGTYRDPCLFVGNTTLQPPGLLASNAIDT
jgi:hypothetical protein